MLAKGEIQLRVGLPPTLPGLIKLITLKVGFTKLTDFGLSNLIKAAPNIQHLERCLLFRQYQIIECDHRLGVRNCREKSNLVHWFLYI